MRSLYVEDIPGKFLMTQAPNLKDMFMIRKFIEKSMTRKFLDLPETHRKKEL